jgi:hypothetical protein
MINDLWGGGEGGMTSNPRILAKKFDTSYHRNNNQNNKYWASATYTKDFECLSNTKAKLYSSQHQRWITSVLLPFYAWWYHWARKLWQVSFPPSWPGRNKLHFKVICSCSQTVLELFRIQIQLGSDTKTKPIEQVSGTRLTFYEKEKNIGFWGRN